MARLIEVPRNGRVTAHEAIREQHFRHDVERATRVTTQNRERVPAP